MTSIRNVLVILAICLLLPAYPLLQPSAAGPRDRAVARLSPLDSSTTQVGFSFDLLNLSSFSFSIGFNTTMAMSGGTVTPGQNLSAAASLSAPAQADLKISYLGVPVSLPINPLGSLYDLAIPGLGYGYHGIAELGLFLNFSGVVLANSSVGGPATSPTAKLTWSTSGTESTALAISPSAPDGSVVTWTLGDISYGVSLGIDAVGTVLGFGLRIPLINFGSLGLVPGTPSSSSSTYSLPASGQGLGSLGTAPGELGLAAIVIIVVVIAVAAGMVSLGRRRRLIPPPPSP